MSISSSCVAARYLAAVLEACAEASVGTSGADAVLAAVRLAPLSRETQEPVVRVVVDTLVGNQPLTPWTVLPRRSRPTATPVGSEGAVRHLWAAVQEVADSGESLAFEVWLPARGWCDVTLTELLAVRREAAPHVVVPSAATDGSPRREVAADAFDLDDEDLHLDAPARAPQSWDADPSRWQQFRVPLGRRANGEVVWSEPFEGVVVAAGAPRSGKTTGFPIPMLASWPGPALVLSARTDVLDSTYEARLRRGPVAVFNPSAATTRMPSTRYDLMRSGARTWPEARRLAEHMTAVDTRPELREGAFWYTKAAQWIGPALYAAGANGYALADVLRWAETDEEYELRALLAAIPGEDGETAMRSIDSVWHIEDRGQSSVMATVTAALAPFQLPTVAAAIGRGFDDSYLVAADDDEARTIYAIAPATEQGAVAPVMTLLVGRAIRAAVAHHLATGEPARLLVVVDEAGNLGSVPQLAELTTTAQGCGVQLTTIWHGMSQVEKVYGALDAETIVDHAPVLVFLRGGSRRSAALLESVVPGMEPGEGLRRLRSIPRGHGIFVREDGSVEELHLLAHWRDADLAASL